LVPNFKGGASVGSLPVNSKTYEFLSKVQGKQKARQTIKQMPTYFGKQPGTSGPVYVGAIIVFLFILGLFLVENKYRIWLLSITIISLVFSWGNNIPNFTSLMLDHLPGYNKFRAVSMTLIIAEFAIPLLAILVLNKIIKGEIDLKMTRKALLYSGAATGGILFIFILFAGAFNFNAAVDQEYLKQGATDFIGALKSDRMSMLRRDSFRSMVFIGLALLVIWFFLNKKMTQSQLIASLGVLVLLDMWTVDKRYLNNDNFITQKQYKNTIKASTADKLILQDRDKDYRVLNMSVDIFNDATTSFYHKSIGGYHGAKMRRYQELIENCIYPELQGMVNDLRSSGMQYADQAMSKMNVLNMLNTRYIIIDTGSYPLVNRSALGNAWFVDSIEIVASADEEIARLNSTNTGSVALVEQQFATIANVASISEDSAANIRLEEYKPNYLKYKSSSTKDGVAVFSEIYYPKGWNATIDGKPTEYFRANYLLRAMLIPAGEHTIEFSFEPKSYYTGEKISYASSLIFLILLLAGIAYEVKKGVSPKK
jgi:hypothetical protein